MVFIALFFRVWKVCPPLFTPEIRPGKETNPPSVFSKCPFGRGEAGFVINGTTEYLPDECFCSLVVLWINPSFYRLVFG